VCLLLGGRVAAECPTEFHFYRLTQYTVKHNAQCTIQSASSPP
jgi:hypothetical protein